MMIIIIVKKFLEIKKTGGGGGAGCGTSVTNFADGINMAAVLDFFQN